MPESFRKILCVLLLSLLVFSLFSVWSTGYEYTGEDRYRYTGAEFSALPHSGYRVEKDKDAARFFTTDGDPQTVVTLSAPTLLDTVILEFSEPVDKKMDIAVYFTTGDEGFAADRVEHSFTFINGRRSAVAFLGAREYVALRLDVDTDFSLTAVRLIDTWTDSKEVSHLNIPSLVLFAVILVLSIALERWLGLYAAIRKFFVAEYDKLISRVREKKFFALAVRLIHLVLVARLAVGLSLMLARADFSAMSLRRFFFLSVFALVFSLLDLAFAEKASPARVFLAVALILGVLLAVLMPPTTFNAWDEETHYTNAVSLKNFLGGTGRTLNDLKLEKRFYMTDFFYKDLPGMTRRMLSEDSVVVETGHKSLRLATLYKYVGYLPAALGMLVSDLFGFNFFQTSFLAKFASLLCYALLVWFGIRRMKSGGYILAAVALLPSAFFLALSYSYDYFVTAGLICFFGLLLSALQSGEEKLSLPTMIALVLSAFLGCGPKAVYFVLFLPVFLLPKEKFSSQRTRRIFFLSALLSALVVVFSFVYPFLSNPDVATDSRGGSTVSSGSQLEFILSDPFGFVKLLFRFFLSYLSLGNMSGYIASFAYLGSPNAIVPTLSVFLLLFAAFTDKSEADGFRHSPLFRAAVLVCSAGALVLVATALYISFTPYGYPTVLGCQYRYVFPILPFFFWAIGSPRLKCGISPAVMKLSVFGVSSLALILSVADVCLAKL